MNTRSTIPASAPLVMGPWRKLLLGTLAALLVIAVGAADASACFRRRCRTSYRVVHVVYVQPAGLPRAYPPVAPGVKKPPAEKIPAPKEGKEVEKLPSPKGSDGDLKPPTGN